MDTVAALLAFAIGVIAAIFSQKQINAQPESEEEE